MSTTTDLLRNLYQTLVVVVNNKWDWRSAIWINNNLFPSENE